jgi:hypothetical protein
MTDLPNVDEHFVVVNVKSLLWKMSAEMEKELIVPVPSMSMDEDELHDYLNEYLYEGDGLLDFYSTKNITYFDWLEEEGSFSIVRQPYRLTDDASA